MFTHQVTIKLKAKSTAEFIPVIENEILPLLRQQKGFRDEVVVVAPNARKP